jgi:hypothetical protein
VKLFSVDAVLDLLQLFLPKVTFLSKGMQSKLKGMEDFVL